MTTEIILISIGTPDRFMFATSSQTKYTIVSIYCRGRTNCAGGGKSRANVCCEPGPNGVDDWEVWIEKKLKG